MVSEVYAKQLGNLNYTPLSLEHVEALEIIKKKFGVTPIPLHKQEQSRLAFERFKETDAYKRITARITK